MDHRTVSLAGHLNVDMASQAAQQQYGRLSINDVASQALPRGAFSTAERMPTPTLEEVADRLGGLLKLAVDVNCQLAGMRSNVFGENDPVGNATTSGEVSSPPCLMARVTRGVDHLEDELQRLSRQVSSVRRLG